MFGDDESIGVIGVVSGFDLDANVVIYPCIEKLVGSSKTVFIGLPVVVVNGVA